MTINSGATKSGPYTANGVQTVFAYGFKVYASTDLEVIETSVAGVESIVSTSSYTVSNVGVDGGGNITFTVAPTSGKKITARLKPPVEQQTNLRNQGGYLPEVVERMGDRLCMLIQYLVEEVGRSVKIDISSSASTATYLQDCQASAAAAAASATAAAAANNLGTNSQSVDYTLVATDANKVVRLTGSTARSFTIPPHSSVAYAIGTQIVLQQDGTGMLTIVPTGGVTLKSENGWTKLAAQYSMATLVKVGNDEWLMSGSLRP